MRIAIFGGGSIGSRHAANARALGHEVKIFDKDEQRGTDPLNAYAWNQFARLPIDAAMICTPASDHEHTARLLRAYGYRGPLFVEKPIALRSNAAVFYNWPHPTTMVGYNWRFHPEAAPLAAIAQRADSVFFTCRTNIQRWPGQGYSDPLLECSHEVDLACAWLGDPTAIAGDADDEGASLQLQHPHGRSLVDVRWLLDPHRTINLQLPGPTRYGSVMARFDVSPDARGLVESYELELRHFLEAARAARSTAIPFSQGLRVVEICERVRGGER